jgi:hypothetical protein
MVHAEQVEMVISVALVADVVMGRAVCVVLSMVVVKMQLVDVVCSHLLVLVLPCHLPDIAVSA